MEAAEQFSPTPKDVMAQLMAKFDTYIHLLDLERKRKELLEDVTSPTRGLNLLLIEYLISSAKRKLESLLPKSKNEIVDEVGDLEVTKEEEVFIDEFVPEFNQDLPQNSLLDASSDSTLDSDSGCQTDSTSVKGLNGFLRSTSNIEAAVISIGDFMVSPYEEISSNSTGVVEEVDSLDLELIPQFFFVKNDADDSAEAVSFQFTSIDKAEVNDFGRTEQTEF
ncbi:hypothetical protein MKX03_035586, partial [Papaver bracteatum]